MPVFTEEMGSLNDAVTELSKNKMAIVAAANDADALAVEEIINGVITVADGGSAENLQLPLAADVVEAIKGCEVGTSFEFVLRNNDAGDDKTVTTNTGWTLVGTMAVQEATHARFLAVVTAVETPAITLYRF